MIDTLKEVMNLFEEAQTAVFKLMASVSHVPSDTAWPPGADTNARCRTLCPSSFAVRSTSRRSSTTTLIR